MESSLCQICLAHIAVNGCTPEDSSIICRVRSIKSHNFHEYNHLSGKALCFKILSAPKEVGIDLACGLACHPVSYKLSIRTFLRCLGGMSVVRVTNNIRIESVCYIGACNYSKNIRSIIWFMQNTNYCFYEKLSASSTIEIYEYLQDYTHRLALE